MRFDVLRYDLTITYIEGEGKEIPKAKHGYSRDHRFDCREAVIGLVVRPEGLPLAHEMMDGNTSDRETLRGILATIETQYGRVPRVWVMDRGIPSEEVLEEMREAERQVFYLVGTPRGKILNVSSRLVFQSVMVEPLAFRRSLGRRYDRAVCGHEPIGLSLRSFSHLRDDGQRHKLLSEDH